MNKIAVFASGSGSNAQRIVEYFKEKPDFNIVLILTNNKNAYVTERAKKLKIPYLIFSKEELDNGAYFINILNKHDIRFIVLAGFLLKIPDYLVRAFENRIVNIHPALLPKYGGKGMYGMNVHKAVINSGEKESGITIHYVNEHYDDGAIIAQFKCDVLPEDTPDSLAAKIHQLEHEHFPKVIEEVLRKT